MTKRKLDAKIVAPVMGGRSHVTFRIREDFLKHIKTECARLNCSRGVYIEVLLQNAWETGAISIADAFQYDSGVEWISQALGIDIKVYVEGGKNPSAPTYMRRPNATFLMRQSYLRKVRDECARLNCSRGVYFELLLKKSWEVNAIAIADVVEYGLECRNMLDKQIDAFKPMP